MSGWEEERVKKGRVERITERGVRENGENAERDDIRVDTKSMV